MTTTERPVTAQFFRCDKLSGTEAAQCELEPDHSGVHAIGTADGYLTWDEVASERSWRRYPAPPWLVALRWAPGFQPEIRGPGDDAATSRNEVDERNLR